MDRANFSIMADFRGLVLTLLTFFLEKKFFDFKRYICLFSRNWLKNRNYTRRFCQPTQNLRNFKQNRAKICNQFTDFSCIEAIFCLSLLGEFQKSADKVGVCKFGFSKYSGRKKEFFILLFISDNIVKSWFNSYDGFATRLVTFITFSFLLLLFSPSLR